MIVAPGLAAALMPDGAAADIADNGQDIPLRDGEAALIADAGAKRRRDFALGRHCAHLALARLSMPADTIGRGPHGEPLWPPGIVGSITHTAGYAAAMVVPRAQCHGIGLDAERIGAVTEPVWRKLFKPEECEELSRLEGAIRDRVATIFFTAKEAHYKACGGGDHLRFLALRVMLDADRVLVSQDNGMACTEGRYAISGDLLLTVLRATA